MALGGALGRAWAPVTPRHFAWQAWHKLTSTVVSRGRRGTNSHLLSVCVAGVGQMALGGTLGRAWAPVTPRHFAWQAWHKLTSTVVSRGRRGTNSHLLSFCVAGVGQMALSGALGRAWAPVTPRHFAWQAWHKLTSTVVSRGRRGTKNELYRFCACFCFDGTLWQRLRMLHSDGTLCSAVAQGQTLYAPEHDANVIERKDGVRPSSEQVLCKQLQLFVCHLLFLHCPWTAVLLQFQRDRIF